MSKSISFFAARTDLLDLLGEIESIRAIHYTVAGTADVPGHLIYRLASEIPDFGIMHVKSANLGPIFLVADIAVAFAVRPIPQRRGGVRFAMDQQLNPDSIAFVPGGRFDDRTVVAGSVGTCTDTVFSNSLFDVVATAIRTKWTVIKYAAVSPDALRILDAGGRLTASIGSPREYDLQR